MKTLWKMYASLLLRQAYKWSRNDAARVSRECLTDKQHKYVTIYCDYFCKEGSTDENERMCKGVDLGKVLHNTPIHSKHPKKVFMKPTFLKYIFLMNFIYHPVILFSQNALRFDLTFICLMQMYTIYHPVILFSQNELR